MSTAEIPLDAILDNNTDSFTDDLREKYYAARLRQLVCAKQIQALLAESRQLEAVVARTKVIMSACGVEVPKDPKPDAIPDLSIVQDSE